MKQYILEIADLNATAIQCVRALVETESSPFKNSSPVLQTNPSISMYFVPKTGTAVLKGSRHLARLSHGTQERHFSIHNYRSVGRIPFVTSHVHSARPTIRVSHMRTQMV